MKRSAYLECSPHVIGALHNEITSLQSVIWHLVYRTHPYSPRFCDGCAKAEEVINEVSGKPLEPWCVPSRDYIPDEKPMGTCETADWPHLASDGSGKKLLHEKRLSCRNWVRI